jgi:hypothetical protein
MSQRYIFFGQKGKFLGYFFKFYDFFTKPVFHIREKSPVGAGPRARPDVCGTHNEQELRI